MSPEELKLSIQEPGTYIVKFGSVPQDKEQTPVTVVGNIDVVSTYIAARVGEVSRFPSHIKVEVAEGNITLVVDENSPFKSTITGKLELHPDFVKWGINSGKQYSSSDLAQMIKMNRYMLPSTARAMELVTVFQSLKAKVQKEIELSDDKRGNKTNLQSQVVLNMSIPTDFALKVPIFKGFSEVQFEVEIAINADTLNIELVSPSANDIIGTTKSGIIEQEIQKVKQHELVHVPILYC